MELNKNSNFKFHLDCLFMIAFNELVLFASNVGCTTTINVFKPSALNPKFQHFMPIYIFKTLLYNNEFRA
jgi:hypothetical protein